MKFETLHPYTKNIFQVAWESTLKCNLDCSYCGDGHDNRTEHPPLANSLNTIDFILEYLSRKNVQKANLNIQGGESLFHPGIIHMLKYLDHKKQEHDYYLGVSFITNAVVGKNLWSRICTHTDFMTISFHAEASEKQHNLVKENILYLKEKNKNFHVAIMMHPKHWDTCIEMIEWCAVNDIKCVPRQIDHHWLDMRFNYNAEQSEYLLGRKITTKDKIAHLLVKGLNLSAEGRSCCSKKDLCASGCMTNYVNNKFKGWTCSVADNFLYIRQNTGEVFTNKDCKMNYDNQVGPIGYLSDTESIFAKMHSNGIVCKKSSCWCGLCAPKAKTREQFNAMMANLENYSQSE
jgi:sulfatase maturation enzyme AslB (radical SAM superfamily)